MPVSYPIPNIKPADPAAHWLQGVSAGVAIAQARNSAELQAQRLQAEERQQETENLRRQQQMEISAQQSAAELGLRKAELDQANKKIDLAAQTVANKFAAQQQYQDMVNSGLSPEEAAMKIGPALMTGSEMGAIFRNQRYAQKPEFFNTPGGNEVGVYGGRLTQLRAQKPSNLEGGAIQSVPVRAPDGSIISGMVGMPTGTGDWNVRSLPDMQAKRAAQAEKTIKRLEESPFGPDLLSGAKEPKNPKYAEAYKSAKAQYDAAKKITESSSESEPAQEDMVMRLTRDGRQAWFNAKTKKFIRYADQPSQSSAGPGPEPGSEEE